MDLVDSEEFFQTAPANGGIPGGVSAPKGTLIQWRRKIPQGKTTYAIPATDFDAVIFDLDGVVTDTASVHAAAWKRMFDDFFSRQAAHRGVSFRPATGVKKRP